MAEPVPPDWPGLWAWTLVPALIAVVGGMVATLGFALRLGDAPGRAGRMGDGVTEVVTLPGDIQLSSGAP